MICKEGQLDVVKMILNNQMQGFWYQFCLKSTCENWVRGNRKTLKCLKMTTKSNFVMQYKSEVLSFWHVFILL